MSHPAANPWSTPSASTHALHQPGGFSGPSFSTPGGARIDVKWPEDKVVRNRIDHVARYVAIHGHPFESSLKARLESQGYYHYGFLFETSSPESLYYRWRCYSLANGDTMRSYRMIPFQMLKNGPTWVPPPPAKSERSRTRSRARVRVSPSGRSPGSESQKGLSDVKDAEHALEIGLCDGGLDSTSKGGHGVDGGQRQQYDHEQTEIQTQTQTHGQRVRKYEGPQNTQFKRNRKRSDDFERVARRNKRRKVWTQMNKEDTATLFTILRELRVSRNSILNGMVFILDRSQHAEDIAKILVESITLRSSLLSVRVARLYLLSDVLYNDVLYNTSALDLDSSPFRDELRPKLRTVFGSFGKGLYRETREDVRLQEYCRIRKVIDAWSLWSLFPQEELEELAADIYDQSLESKQSAFGYH